MTMRLQQHRILKILDARPGFIIKILKRSLIDKFIKTQKINLSIRERFRIFNIEFIEFLEFSAILELIDNIILILLSIFPFTLKIYENNYYAINMKSRSLFNLNFLKPYTRH